MNPATIMRLTCRVCQSSDLSFLFTIGNQYVSGFPAPGEPDGPRIPIDIMLCRNCTLVQQRYTAPQELLYRRFYWYRSSVTDSMKTALKDIAESAMRLVNLQPGDVVLDIGSNDGTLLRFYKELSCQAQSAPGEAMIDCDKSWPGRYGPITVGVEPAENLWEEGSKGVNFLIKDFWSYQVYEKEWLKYKHWPAVPKAKIATAAGMAYDLEQPVPFIADIAKVLAPDGVFIMQLMCLRNMLALADVGNLVHEHLEFWSLASLSWVFDRCGLKLIDIETNTVNGQSYRLYVTHRDSPVKPFDGAMERLAVAMAEEHDLADPEYYEPWFEKLVANRDKCVTFIRSVVTAGKRVHVLGSSTKGNVILQFFGLDNSLIEAASERSDEKHGRRTVGTGIKIISEQQSRDMNPDFYLVLPWAFRYEILTREKEWHNAGGKFIFPLPKFEVV